MAAFLRSPLGLLLQKRAVPAFSAAAVPKSLCSAASSKDGAAAASRRGAGMGTVTPWTIPYRERIVIGMSPLIDNNGVCEPLKEGEIGITVEALFPDTDDETGNYVTDIGDVEASGKPLAAAVGSAKFDGKWQLYLYALKAGAVLAKKLEEEGKHIGPVVYRTRHVGLNLWFSGMHVENDKDGGLEEMLKDYMPDDLDEFASSCEILYPPKQMEEEVMEDTEQEQTEEELKEDAEQNKSNAGSAPPTK